ncbi:MAG: oxidoreductase [Flavipsychrobacter sp.]|nr:oxidoreductase [Flavipsychrobacter sp.]
MKYLLFSLLIIAQHASAQQLSVNTIVPKTDASFRGLCVIDESIAWVSGSKGWIGKSINGGKEWVFNQVKGYEKCDFRSLYAFDANRAVIANAGAPAYILYTKDGGANWTIVYQNNDSAAFFDGIGFWNEKKGIIYGDPIKGKLLLLQTTDGGEHWQELPGKSRPALTEGEASFAASGTSIRLSGKSHIVIATGGKVSRLLISGDKGISWQLVQTPILQGASTTGIFSVAYRNNKTAIIAGGDYKQDTLKEDHIFYTKDGGKTWTAPKSPTRGYRECVEYLDEKTVIATGPAGTDISFDAGATWQALSDEKQFHTVRKSRKGNLIIMTGGGGKIAVVK